MLGLVAQMGILGLTACISIALSVVGTVVGTIISVGVSIHSSNVATENAERAENMALDQNNKAQALAKARSRAADIANKKNLKKAQYQAVSASTLNRIIAQEAKYKTARLNRDAHYDKRTSVDMSKPSVRVSGFTYSRGAPVGK